MCVNDIEIEAPPPQVTIDVMECHYMEIGEFPLKKISLAYLSQLSLGFHPVAKVA